MDDATRRDNELFEQEVMRIARALWPSAELSGSAKLDGREIDAVFETEDCIHIIEATTSRRQDKARNDITKLTRAITRFRRQSATRAVKGWFITRDEPTADQRKITDKQKNSINSLSFSQFQARLINSREYLAARDNYPFGSVRDPGTGESSPTVEYVPLDLLDIQSGQVFSRESVRSLIVKGSTFVLLGDYGAGKSMTLREIYRSLRKSHLRGDSSTFPVYLNLRDHYGQTDTAEVFTRHARSVGFSHPEHLVRAWRAGYVHLLIDGFDEISTVAIQGLWHDLQNNRYRAMEAVRRLVREHPQETGLLITGRAHFFDNREERQRALGLSEDAIELSLNEFNDFQIDLYLRRAGLSGSVPTWLPSRPLLIGYLAAKGLLGDLFAGDSGGRSVGPAEGWNALLDSVALREAQIEAGIDGTTVRRILERLSTMARNSQSGLGALTTEALMQTFREVCGYSPDDRGLVLLQRLPGLGVDREDENSRTFIDETFADACRAGDLITFIDDPFNFSSSALAEVENSIGGLGIDVAAWKAKRKKYTQKKINSALVSARNKNASYMASDIVRLMWELGNTIEEECSLSGLLIQNLEYWNSGANLSALSYRDCFFAKIELEPDIDASAIPKFYECFVDEVEGRVSIEDLPAGVFNDRCDINRFTNAADTTAGVLTLDLPLSTKVCLTILKKLYEQSGSGRRENALYRGLDHRARQAVPRVLQLLQSEGFAVPDRSKKNTVWQPCRTHRQRAGNLLTAPTETNDPLLERCAALSK